METTTQAGTCHGCERGHFPEVESFYHLPGGLSREARCQGLACFAARHSDPERWRLAAGESPPVYCLGKCFAGPADTQSDPRPRVEVCAPHGIVLGRMAVGGARSVADYLRHDGYEGLRIALTRPPEAVVVEMEASGLRGRGGAGFPTGLKWRAALSQPAGQKFIVANADEGDPGAYVDRFLMEDDPHSLLEGMVIAGYAVGASRGYIYIRAEYPQAASVLREAAAEARSGGYLGERILGSGFSFDIEIVVGKGSYVCGEETALLNSIEGKRPVAMARPPYATERGLFGRPTVINNVETLVNVPWILRRGGDAYHALGFSKSRGTKGVSLNSLFRRPGLYEVEFGIPLRQIVYDLGGGLRSGDVKGVMIGGPLAGLLPPEVFDTPFGFEELAAVHGAVGHGGVIAFDEQTAIPELIHNIFAFAACESCAKCPPCRLGSRRVEQIFERVLAAGPAPRFERHEWLDIVAALKLASLCGMGTGLAEFAESVLRYYGKELEPCFT